MLYFCKPVVDQGGLFVVFLSKERRSSRETGGRFKDDGEDGCCCVYCLFIGFLIVSTYDENKVNGLSKQKVGWMGW